jgi:glycosyltransferase involved in cell wall biosynthesis
MKINWFSPLSPAATDIAHYTARVLPALAALAEVTLWTTSRHWVTSLEQFAEVRRYGLDRLPSTELNRADMTFYHIGNNPRFHWPIWHVSRVHPGVIVLHDLRLHHFFDWIYRVHYQNLPMYLETMETFYGESAQEDARECFNTNAANIEYMAQRYPLTDLALQNALGAIVHTQEAYDVLKPNADWPLMYAPLPFPTVESIGLREAGPPYRLIVFGYLGRNRRLDSVLEALAGFSGREHFRLDIFGSVLEDEQRIRAKIRNLKLTASVRLHGFVPEERLQEALAQSHLAINLRFPTVGEASGSQLRIWSHRLPSLVSDVGWYASLPGDTIAFVRHDEHEISDIQDHLSDFLDSPDSFARMGLRGFEELRKNHSPAAYAQQIESMVELAKGFRPQFAARALARRASVPLAQWLSQSESDEPLRHLVREAMSLVRG